MDSSAVTTIPVVSPGPTFPSPQPAKPPLSPQKSILPLLLTILFLLTLAATGVLAYQNRQLNQRLSVITASPTPTPQIFVPPADPTTGWKTYSNPSSGISFKYPAEWRFTESETFKSATFNTKIPSSETRGEQTIDYTFDSILEDSRNYNDWVNNPGQTTALGTETINNNLFEKFVVADMYYSLNYIYKANDKIIRFMVWPYNAQNPEKLPASLKESVYQVLSTFKFLDNTTNWKTYTDSKNGFSIRYPSTWRSASLGENGIGFGPKEIGEDVLWGINVYDKSVYPKEKIIDEAGKQFSDRKQNTNNIDINGIQTTRLITTTSSIPDWYLETIIIEYGSNFVTISNGAINDTKLQTLLGVPKGTTFKDFYSTFKFTQ